MSIQWNKEVKMKDVAKFFNQEIHLGEVDYNKCLQVSTLIVAFGVIPSFTYGTVLGTLEAQREALVSEVLNLQAQVVSTLPKVASTTVVHSASTDKTIYNLGSSTTVYFYNNVASTTNVVNLDLHLASGVFVQRIVSMIPYAGPNKHTFTISSSTLEKGSSFFVKATATKFGQSVSTNKFEVKKIVTPITSNVKRFILETEGGYITQGQNLDLTGDIKIRCYYNSLGNCTNISFYFQNGWSLGLAAPKNKTSMTVGNYADAWTWPNADQPYLSMSAPGRGGDNAGSFIVHEIRFNEKGELINAAIDFTHIQLYGGKPTGPKSEGQIRYNSNYPVKIKTVAAQPTIDANSTTAKVTVFRAADVELSFVVNNTGKQDIYIGKDGLKSIGYGTTAPIDFSTITGSALAGDTQGAYMIKAGTKRFLSLNVVMVNKSSEKMQSYAVKKIYFSDEQSSLNKYSISSGLENLKITQSF